MQMKFRENKNQINRNVKNRRRLFWKKKRIKDKILIRTIFKRMKYLLVIMKEKIVKMKIIFILVRKHKIYHISSKKENQEQTKEFQEINKKIFILPIHQIQSSNHNSMTKIITLLVQILINNKQTKCK